MPFAVTQWPNAPDPRLPSFDLLGYAFGQVPAFIWVVSTTGATGPYSILNTGVSCAPLGQNLVANLWLPNSGVPLGLDIVLNTIGSQDPAGVPLHTKEWNLTVFEAGTTSGYQGQLFKTYPTAIAVQSPLVMLPSGSPAGIIPNPIVLTPAKWDFEFP